MNALAPNITPTDEQWRCIKKAVEWYRTPKVERKPFFYIGGWAGTGKSTIAKIIRAELNLSTVLSATFTGKAALVLRTKGFDNCSTIHSLIYTAIHKGKGRIPELQEKLRQLQAEDPISKSLVEAVEKDIEDEIKGLRKMSWDLNTESDLRLADVLFIDEVSMVGNRIGEDLLKFGIPIIVLGDPGQLPPVGDMGFFTANRPDFQLQEIHRQAKDSAVIRIATKMRLEGKFEIGTYEDPSGFTSEVVPYHKYDPEKILATNQILVGRNATRHVVNGWARAQKGRRGRYPLLGDRLICLKNNHDIGIINGGFYESLSDAQDVGEGKHLIKVQSLDFPQQDVLDLLTHSKLYGGDPKQLDPWAFEEAQSFDHGEAITVHKSQGSQWEHVAFRDEWPVEDTFRQHAYTATTRAAKSVYVVLREQ